MASPHRSSLGDDAGLEPPPLAANSTGEPPKREIPPRTPSKAEPGKAQAH